MAWQAGSDMGGFGKLSQTPAKLNTMTTEPILDDREEVADYDTLVPLDAQALHLS